MTSQSQRGVGQGFCDDSDKALVIETVTMEEGSKIVWCYLCTTPKILLLAFCLTIMLARAKLCISEAFSSFNRIILQLLQLYPLPGDIAIKTIS